MKGITRVRAHASDAYRHPSAEQPSKSHPGQRRAAERKAAASKKLRKDMTDGFARL